MKVLYKKGDLVHFRDSNVPYRVTGIFANSRVVRYNLRGEKRFHVGVDQERLLPWV